MKEPDVNFRDRFEAGQILANRLTKYADKNPLILALPRGGLPVAFEVARTLKAPMDVYIVRKLGVPGQEELAMGAMASGGVRVLNQPVVDSLRISDPEIEIETKKEQAEIIRRENLYRAGRPPLDVSKRTILLIDDGIATGSTIKAAIAALKKQGAGAIIVGVPVAPVSTIEELKKEVDEVVCVSTPDFFYAISLWYDRFPQVTDEEVCDFLKKAESSQPVTAAAAK